MKMHAHHRRMRSQGGEDSWGNLIEIPPDLHELVHANPELGYAHGLLVKSHDDPHVIRPDVAGFMASIGREGEVEKPKKVKRAVTDEELAKRKTASVRLPEGVNGLYWKELLKEAESTELEQPDTQFDKSMSITTGKLLVTVLERFTGRA